MDRCPHMNTIVGRNKEGDIKGECDWCNLSDHPCLLMSDDTCEEWEERRLRMEVRFVRGPCMRRLGVNQERPTPANADSTAAPQGAVTSRR